MTRFDAKREGHGVKRACRDAPAHATVSDMRQTDEKCIRDAKPHQGRKPHTKQISIPNRLCKRTFDHPSRTASRKMQ